MDKKDLDKGKISIYNCIYLEYAGTLVKEIRWNKLKSIHLKFTRGVSFEEIVRAKFLDLHDHPKRNNQKILVYEYKGYAWAVPFVLENARAFLKTLYPSRKFRKLYKKG
ncbi:MAG: toxin [Candidatus Omnitrophica bacterium]|nr:toxin [Candidatus Omnitrophota bacterium]